MIMIWNISILSSILKVYIYIGRLNMVESIRKATNSSSFDINVPCHTHFMSYCAKSFFNERFGEDIRPLMVGAHKFKFNVPFLHMISYEIVSNFNVLSARVLNRIFT